MTECSQRLKTVAYDLSNRQHGHREDRARNTPHPEPEGERDDDEDGIEGEPSGQKHRRQSLALNQMKSKIKTRRKQRLPERVMGSAGASRLHAHLDLCVVPTLTLERLFAFVVVGRRRRQLLWFAATGTRQR